MRLKMKIGIDVGGSHIGVGLIKENGIILGKEVRDNIASKLKEEEAKKFILDTIYEEISDLLKKHDYEEEDISKIGLAVPGNPSNTAIRNAVNMNITRFEIVPILEKKYQAKVKIKNDGRCAGLAEKKYGALKRYDNCIFLCFNTNRRCV